jgi:hypothetical protein
MSDVALSPCDLSVAFVYRERVEDAQVLLDSSLKHQQGICHMHAVFVAWDVPFLAHQVGKRNRRGGSQREAEGKEREGEGEKAEHACLHSVRQSFRILWRSILSLIPTHAKRKQAYDAAGMTGCSAAA